MVPGIPTEKCLIQMDWGGGEAVEELGEKKGIKNFPRKKGDIILHGL